MGNQRTGPLDGTRIVHLASVGPGPLGVMLLADLGADVIVVDRMATGGTAAAVSPERDPRRRGQRSIRLDLRDGDAREVFLRLADSADVLIEGGRPGAAERLGVGPETCQRRNPQLVYARMTGWGQTGPLSRHAGHDINYLALSGALHAIGPAELPPVVPLNLVADFGGGGTYLAIAVLAALQQRGRTGIGDVVDVAMVDGVASLTAMFHGMVAEGTWSDRRSENSFDGSTPYYRTYETSDGRAVAVGPLEERFYREMLTTLGMVPEHWPQGDRGRWSELEAELRRRFAARTMSEWERIFEGTDACVAPVLTFREAAGHPHHQERDTYVIIDGVVHPSPVPRFASTPLRAPQRPRAPGADAEELLREVGLSDGQLQDLRARDVAG